MKPLYAFCGPIGSGKSCVSKLFAKQIGAKWNSFGNTVKEIAQERGVQISREELQKLGAHLIEIERETFCRRVLSPVLGGENESGVIDGLRHADVLNELRVVVSPRKIVCVYVNVSPEIRLERVAKRDGLDAKALAALDSHSTELQVQTELRKLADFVASNDGTPEECMINIVDWSNTFTP